MDKVGYSFFNRASTGGRVAMVPPFSKKESNLQNPLQIVGILHCLNPRLNPILNLCRKSYSIIKT